MLNNPLGVQIIFGLGLAKPLEPMTPPHLQIAWAHLLTCCLPFHVIESFKKPSFEIHFNTTMQRMNWKNIYPF
jgi:hypothetical protein